TCALFFACAWLAYLARFLTEARPVFAIIAAVAGSLGILAKSTTFPAFAVLGGLLFLKECSVAWTTRAVAERARLILLAALVITVPFVIGGVWTVYSDAVKMKNELGVYLTSTGLAKWNFGTLDQRFSTTLWKEIIWKRVLADSFGYSVIPALVLIAASLLRRRYAYATLAAVVAFLVPFLVFTNLHLIHNYYQTANVVFIVAATGLGIAGIMSTRYAAIAVLALAIIVAGQLLY